MGYDVGEPDGRPGSRTRAAIRQYQSDNNFEATGELSGAQAERLMGDREPAGGERDQEPGGEVQLTSSEMKDMQRGLAALGFDIGEPDGVAGARTGRAISRFLTDRGYDPYKTPVHVAQRLVMDAAGQREGREEASAGLAADAIMPSEVYFDRGGNSVNSDADDAALNEAFGRRLLAADKAILANPQTMARWLESMGRGQRGTWSPAQAKSQYQRYREGSEFDKQETLNVFGAYLSNQVANDPMRVTRIRSAQLGTYDFNTMSFPLRHDDALGKSMVFYGPANNLVNVEVENWNVPDNLPMSKEQAETLAAELNQSGSRTVSMVATFQLSPFTLEDDGYNPRTIRAQAVVERISLHRINLKGDARFGNQLLEIPIPQPTHPATAKPEITGPALSNLQSWTRLGVPTRDGRILVTADRFGEDGKAIDDALKLLGIAKSPEEPKSLGTAFNYAKRFAPQTAFRSIFPVGRDEAAFLRQFTGDPFRQKELVDRFNSEILPQIVSKAPVLPVKMRIGVKLQIHGYDVATETYSIDPSYPNLLGGLQSDLKRQLPHRLQVPVKIARRLSDTARARKQDLQLYFAFDIDVHSVAVQFKEYELSPFSAGSTFSTFRGKAAAVALYQDAALTQMVMPLPLGDFVVEQVALPGSPKPDGIYLSRWNVASMTTGLVGDPDMGSGLVRASEFVRRQNEFGRDDAIKRGLAQLAASTVIATEPLYLMGSIRLGTYEDGAFGIVRQNFLVSLEPDTEQLDSELITVAGENSDMLARFSMDKAAAEKLVKDYPTREFPALFKVRPARAEKLSEGKALVRLDLFIDEVHLMDTRHPDRVILSWKDQSDTGANGEASLEKIPTSLPLNYETTALLAAKHGGAALDDVALKALLALRWEEENQKRYDIVNVDPAPWGRFFPLNYRKLTEADYARLLPRFRAWTQERLRTLPDKLVYEISHQSGEGYGFGAPPNNYVELLAKGGIDLRGFGSYRGWLFTEPVADGANGWKRPQSILGLRQDKRWDSRVDVYVPLPDIPSTPREPFARAVSLDMTVRAAFSTADVGDGKPAVLLDVVPTEVRWLSEKTAASPRRLLASFKIAPVGPRREIAPTNLDILGIAIGMAQAEAEDRLRQALAVGRILELKGDPSDRTAVAESARMYVSEDGADLVGVLYGPLAMEAQVYGVARMHFAQPGSVTKGQALGAMEAKYGALRDPNNWRWGDTAGLGNCGARGFASVNWSGANVIDGKPLLSGQVTMQQVLADPTVAADILLIRRLEYIPWAFDIQDQVAQCKPTLTAEFQDSFRVGRAGEQIPGADSSVLRTWLFDHAKRTAALLEAQNAPRAAPAKMDLKL